MNRRLEVDNLSQQPNRDHRDKRQTQEALAENVGISVRYTQSIEAGEYWPALPTLLKLRKTLCASWEEMFRGCGE